MDDHPQKPGNYESDFHAWASEQAALLRDGRLAEADIANIAEEIESLGRGEKRELINRLAVLLAHLLKWRFQPAWRGKSWHLTIREQRRKIAKHLGENPSLRPGLADAITEAYADAISDVQKATPLDEDDLPAACPFTAEQILDTDFLPQ
jgi:ribosomal protein L29